MRIPIAILMLCLPVAAMGEIFSCTSTYGALIQDDGITVQNLANVSYVVDTRRGLRVPSVDGLSKEYIGECEVTRARNAMGQEALSAFCTAKENFGFIHMIAVNKLTTGEIKFASSRYLTAANGAYAGKCVEI